MKYWIQSLSAFLSTHFIFKWKGEHQQVHHKVVKDIEASMKEEKVTGNVDVVSSLFFHRSNLLFVVCLVCCVFVCLC